ncbi:MAG TPA: NAD(P)-dependent alcohol dehydrogenase [Solirubrobacteraceae bacterium]|nr:NAD(P)-dependent alcohol dehydrogenase [Solirubrobacteraceae bacterium]
MKAARLHSYDEDHLHLEQVPEPDLQDARDVIVRVAGAGLCRTDLHIIEGIWKDILDPKLPYTLGHENAGWVEEVGEGVASVAPGDPVIVHPQITCGVCLGCRRGEDMYCERSQFPGLDADGGFATFLRTSERSLIKLDHRLDPTDVAPFADAGITAYRAAKRAAARLPPGSRCVVIGVGGLGHVGVQVLRALCAARIIAVDISDAALELAGEVGADELVKADADVVERVKELSDGRGVDAVIDFVAEHGTTEQGPAMLAQGGGYYVVGYGGRVDIPAIEVIFSEIEVIGNLVGNYVELVELMELAAQGKVKLRAKRYGLDQINDAIDDFVGGRIHGRGVIVPETRPA